MGSKSTEGITVHGDIDANSETTVEIKIKTLDSQTYTLRVDKCVPVPALKEQIATVTGVLSEQQRLICRGKVLKDDQLLSAYHVEDGHTLHLVVRQPLAQSSESLPNNPANDSASSTGHNQGARVGPGIVIGSYNISDQGDGGFPDLSRIVSAVLGSFGVPSSGSGSEVIDLNGPLTERLSGFGDLRNPFRQQSDQVGMRDQPAFSTGASSSPAAIPLESFQPPVIPDSLTTLTQYLNHLRQEFSATVRGLSNGSPAAGFHGSDRQDLNSASHSSEQRGLPTPASLAEVMLSARQLLVEDVAECLQQLATLLEGHPNATDPSDRMRIQSHAIRTGSLFQNLGALLLELGRTTMTLRMGQSPVDAVVNAGPAVFVSTAGPNPLMVQPLPFQPGTTFGAIPIGTAQIGSGLSGGPVGSSFVPRNIDIRIRTAVNRRETAGSHHPGQTGTASYSGNANQQVTVGVNEGASTRESEVRVVPIRTVVAAVPAPVGRPTSDSSRSSVGIFYPVFTRVQHVNSGNSNTVRGSQAADHHQAGGVDIRQQPIADASVQQQTIQIPAADGNSDSLGGMSNSEGFSAQIRSGLDQLLRTMFPTEQHGESGVNSQDLDGNSVPGSVEAARDVSGSQEAATGVGEEGFFLSNLLRQIMPIISDNTETGSSNPSLEGETNLADGTVQSSVQGQENPEQGSSSRRRRGSPTESSSKRQKRE